MSELTFDDAVDLARRHGGSAQSLAICIHGIGGDALLAIEAELRDRGLAPERTTSGESRSVSAGHPVRVSAWLPYRERFPDEPPSAEQQLADTRAELEAVRGERDAALRRADEAENRERRFHLTVIEGGARPDAAEVTRNG